MSLSKAVYSRMIWRKRSALKTPSRRTSRPVRCSPSRVCVDGDDRAVVVDVPRRVVVGGRERGAVLGEDAVAGHRDDAEPERHRQLADVGLDLRLRGGDVGVRRARALELDDRERQPVDVEDDVEAPLVLPRADDHLVDGVVLVLLRPVAEEPDGGVLLTPVGVGVREAAVAVDEVVVEPGVLGDGVLRARREDVGARLLEVLGRHLRVEPHQRGHEHRRHRRVGPRLPLAAAGRDVRAAQRLPHVGLGKPLEREDLPVLLAHPMHAGHHTTPSTIFSASLTRTFPDMSNGSNASRVAASCD